MATKAKIVKPDSKGRVSLGKLSKNVTSFSIEVLETGKILLTPSTEIPEKEEWLYKNPEALNSVLTGIKQANEGKVKSLGSFAEFANENID